MIENNIILLGATLTLGSNCLVGNLEQPFVLNMNNNMNNIEIVSTINNPKNLLATKSIDDLCKEAKKRKLEEEKKQQEQKELEKARIEKENKIKELKRDNRRMDTVGINSNNLTVKSNITVEEFNKVFDYIGQPQMKKLSKAFVNAEHKYGVNALFLAGIVAQESLWSKRPAGDGTNLTGYCVYTKDCNGKTFNSYYSNIMATAKLLSEQYLNPKGRYYNGKSMIAVNELYCKYQDQVTTDYS